MARVARLVVPRMPHHVTQRGNRRQATFFDEDVFIPTPIKEYPLVHFLKIGESTNERELILEIDFGN